MIQLKHVLHQLENPARDRSGNPVPAHIEFVTCNLAKRTGGELVSLDAVVLARLAGRRGRGRRAGETSGRPGRKPRRRDTGTRTLYLVASQQTRTVHIRLITLFNHETVVY